MILIPDAEWLGAGVDAIWGTLPALPPADDALNEYPSDDDADIWGLEARCFLLEDIAAELEPDDDVVNIEELLPFAIKYPSRYQITTHFSMVAPIQHIVSSPASNTGTISPKPNPAILTYCLDPPSLHSKLAALSKPAPTPAAADSPSKTKAKIPVKEPGYQIHGSFFFYLVFFRSKGCIPPSVRFDPLR